MTFVLFFRGMLVALLIFAVTIYLLTGSFATTLWQTIACAILLQVGYFVGVLFLVWRGVPKARALTTQEESDPWEQPKDVSGDHGKLPGATSPHRL